MQFTYELTEQDFIEAYSAHRNSKVFTKWFTRLFFWLLVMLAVLGIIAMAIAHNPETTRNLLPLLFVIPLWLVFGSFLPRWNMRRQFRKQPGAQGPKSISFDGDGVHWRSESGTGDTPWKNYIRWVKGKNQILLYSSPVFFGIISTRTLTPAQLAELTEVLNNNMQPTK